MNGSRPPPLALPVALVLVAASAGAEPLDEALYAGLLERHTRSVADVARTRVDYAGLARSPRWRELVANVSRTDPRALRTRDERLAYWINVYNILAIELVVTERPAESIRDIGSFLRPVWKRRAGTIAGRDYTLAEIEHGILRPLGEPRIHAAIVCASVSCPTLRRAPWTESQLDAQLARALRDFLADPDKGLRIEPAQAILRLSVIFDWFAGDFEEAGGVVPYLLPYMPQAARAWVEATGGAVRIRYFDYDWSLNALAADSDGRFE